MFWSLGFRVIAKGGVEGLGFRTYGARALGLGGGGGGPGFGISKGRAALQALEGGVMVNVRVASATFGLERRVSGLGFRL